MAEGGFDPSVLSEGQSSTKGVAVLIVNIGTEESKNIFSPRPGAQNDLYIYTDFFKNRLGFTVINEKFENLNVWDWNHDRLKQPPRATPGQPCKPNCLRCLIQNYDYTSKDCFILAISSHGSNRNGETCIQFVDGNSVSMSEIFDVLSDDNVPTLRGKPRILFIQCCRKDPESSGCEDPGVEDPRPGRDSRPPQESTENVQTTETRDCLVTGKKLPTNFMVVYATMPGKFSKKQPHGASWMESEMQKVLAEKYEGQTELSLFTFLTEVAYEIGERDFKTDGKISKNAVNIQHRLSDPIIFELLPSKESQSKPAL